MQFSKLLQTKLLVVPKTTGGLTVKNNPTIFSKSELMKTTKLMLLLAITIALSAVLIQNQSVWQIRFLWFTAAVPSAILLFLTMAAGLLIGVIVSILLKRDYNHKI